MYYPFMFFPLIKGSTHLTPDDFPSSLILLVSSADMLITFANSLNPDQVQQNVGPDTNCLKLRWYSKMLILKKISRRQKKHVQ